MVIRKLQMDLMAEANRRAFQRRALRHCQDCFPWASALLGDTGVRSYVETGLQKAAAFGFDSEPDPLKYLNLVFTFGPDFDQLPWAAEILADHSFAAPVRIAILTDTALDELRDSPGAEEEETPPAEADSEDSRDAFAGWPETPPAPLPAAAVLQPPGETALPPAPPDLFRMDQHYDW